MHSQCALPLPPALVMCFAATTARVALCHRTSRTLLSPASHRLATGGIACDRGAGGSRATGSAAPQRVPAAGVPGTSVGIAPRPLIAAQWAHGLVGCEDAWRVHPFWELAPSELATWSWTVAKAGVADPFFWRAVRLRARVLATALGAEEVAVLLSCCLRVGLADALFLIALRGRLEALLRWGPVKPRTLLVSCNALLRLGLSHRDEIFKFILRCVSLAFGRPSKFESVMLATCLARLKNRDGVLLDRAEATLLEAGASVKHCSMLLSSFAHLRHRRPDGVAEMLLRQLEQSEAAPETRRSLLAVLAAEGRPATSAAGAQRAFEVPTELAQCAARQLASLSRVAMRPTDLRVIVFACARCGTEGGGALAALAPLALAELGAWVAGRRGPVWGPPPDTRRLLGDLAAVLPLCGPDSSQDTEVLLSRVTEQLGELSASELVAVTELCALTEPWRAANEASTIAGVDNEEQRSPASCRALALRAELYKRAQDIPLRELPRALAALLQLVPEEELVPTLRRCAGRLVLELEEALRLPECQARRLAVLGADALGELLYVFAACAYKDEEFLDACRRWILAAGAHVLGQVDRDISLIHILHSLAVLNAAHGELLHALVAELEARVNRLGPFELLGLLDAAMLLQAQAGEPVHLQLRDGPPPSGLGERALLAVVERTVAILAQFQEDEMQLCARLLRSLRFSTHAAGLITPVLDAADSAAMRNADEGPPDRVVARQEASPGR